MTKEIIQNELESLKLFCDNANIPYHPSISLEKLKAKVEKYHEAQEEKEIKHAIENAHKSAEEKARNDAMKLVRVQITCMDPSKRDYTADILSAGNSVVGTVTRTIPFGVDWHIEQILLDSLRDRTFRQTYQVPDGKGGKIRKNRFVKTYAITELPKLTLDELKDLAQQQASRGSIEEDY